MTLFYDRVFVKFNIRADRSDGIKSFTACVRSPIITLMQATMYVVVSS